jgi:uncharacterized membrane protein
MDAITASEAPDRLMFEAEIKPHRSLAPRQVWMVAGFMLAASAAVTSLMVLLGAWPVIGFNGAEITLALLLLWLNMRAARARETIWLTETRLLVTRRDVRGRAERFSLPNAWLKLALEERAGTVPKLIFSTRGNRLEVGRALGEAEKRNLAVALDAALARSRSPNFDNPQLRPAEMPPES